MLSRTTLLVVTLLVLAVATPAAAAPGKSPAFEVETLTVTFPDYPNPCTGTETRAITIDGTIYLHGFDRPNGSHANIIYVFGASTTDGFSSAPRVVGVATYNSNGDNEVYTESDNWVVTNDEGAKYLVQGRYRTRVINGELKTDFGIDELICVKH